MKWMLKKKERDGWRFPSLFDNFFENFGLEPSREAGWSPRLDISETETEFVVKADVPGVDPKELDISLEDDILTVSGEKKEEHEEKEENYHRIERSYGSFSRSIKLPSNVDSSKIEAGSKDGVLKLVIPKVEEEKKKFKIDVK
ncbi:MAG: Hsp20/alpha crystallin family protein [Planctomycetota bacterium]